MLKVPNNDLWEHLHSTLTCPHCLPPAHRNQVEFMSAAGRPSHRTVCLRFQCFCWNRRQRAGSSARHTEGEKSCLSGGCRADSEVQAERRHCPNLRWRRSRSRPDNSPTDQSDRSECRCEKLFFIGPKASITSNAASVCRLHVKPVRLSRSVSVHWAEKRVWY